MPRTAQAFPATYRIDLLNLVDVLQLLHGVFCIGSNGTVDFNHDDLAACPGG